MEKVATIYNWKDALQRIYLINLILYFEKHLKENLIKCIFKVNKNLNIF